MVQNGCPLKSKLENLLAKGNNAALQCFAVIIFLERVSARGGLVFSVIALLVVKNIKDIFDQCYESFPSYLNLSLYPYSSKSYALNFLLWWSVLNFLPSVGSEYATSFRVCVSGCPSFTSYNRNFNTM